VKIPSEIFQRWFNNWNNEIDNSSGIALPLYIAERAAEYGAEQCGQQYECRSCHSKFSVLPIEGRKAKFCPCCNCSTILPLTGESK